MCLSHSCTGYKTLRLKSCDSCLKLLLVAILSIAFLSSCKEPDPPPEGEMEEMQPLEVWRGVDISYVNEMEDCGAVYRTAGEIRDPYEILADKGANLARFRLWHNPDWTEYSTAHCRM